MDTSRYQDALRGCEGKGERCDRKGMRERGRDTSRYHDFLIVAVPLHNTENYLSSVTLIIAHLFHCHGDACNGIHVWPALEAWENSSVDLLLKVIGHFFTLGGHRFDPLAIVDDCPPGPP